MALTLEEIARHAGVSRSTVSRVVNGDPNVSDTTRAHVLGVIQRHNYQPNAAARSLAAGHTRILGLVIPMGVSALFIDPYFPLLIQGVSSACNAHDHSVMLWLADPEYERRTVHQITNNSLIDGVLIASMLNDDSLVLALSKSTKPFILIGRHPTNRKISYVDVENREGARDATTHLLRLGRQRVAAISGPLNMIAGLDRHDGYLEALRSRGVRVDPRLIVESDFTEAGGYAATQRLVAFKPDAIFVASDTMALGTLRALREAGLRVPDDVALVGFDDMPFAAHTNPPLSSVRQPIHRTGAMAAETLMDMVTRTDNQPRRLVLPTELVIRSSSEAPQAEKMR
jgi:LacI family transcriptional regulator